MKRLTVMIADDERPAREYLKRLLEEFPHAKVVAEAANGHEALQAIRNTLPDLALLDLQMPEMSGLEVVSSLEKNETPLIAFVTAFDQYAVDAFELNAIDYLLKPVEQGRLAATLDRAAERLQITGWREEQAQRLDGAASTYNAASGTISRIPVRKGDEIYLLPIADVVSIVADGELLRIISAANQRFTINYRLKDIEPRLPDDSFVRLSRSALANISMIETISPMPGGTYLVRMTNGQELQASRMQSKFLRERLLKL